MASRAARSPAFLSSAASRRKVAARTEYSRARSVISGGASRSPPPAAAVGAQNVRRAHSARPAAATGGPGGCRPHAAARGPAASPFRFCGGSNRPVKSGKFGGRNETRGVCGPAPAPARQAGRGCLGLVQPSSSTARGLGRAPRGSGVARLCAGGGPHGLVGHPASPASPLRPDSRAVDRSGTHGASVSLRPGKLFAASSDRSRDPMFSARLRAPPHDQD